MKRVVVWLIPLALANLTGYAKIGVEHYCNVNAEDKTIQCNYASSNDCLSYMQAGEACVYDGQGRPAPITPPAARANDRFVPPWQQPWWRAHG